MLKENPTNLQKLVQNVNEVVFMKLSQSLEM